MDLFSRTMKVIYQSMTISMQSVQSCTRKILGPVLCNWSPNLSFHWHMVVAMFKLSNNDTTLLHMHDIVNHAKWANLDTLLVVVDMVMSVEGIPPDVARCGTQDGS